MGHGPCSSIFLFHSYVKIAEGIAEVPPVVAIQPLTGCDFDTCCMKHGVTVEKWAKIVEASDRI